MTRRLKVLGMVLALIGLGFIVGGGVAYTKVQAGYDSLKALSAAQNVKLTYNASGQLADNKGSTKEATAIMALLTDDWKYPVVKSDLNPNDPVVNTASEYMYQMATVTYHTLTREQTVVLPEDVKADNGKVYKAGTYQFNPNGRYWTGYDRSNPIEAVAREQAWTGTAHGLVAELGVGTVTHSALQLGLAISAILAGVGGTILLAGLGLLWAVRAPKPVLLAAPVAEQIPEPVTV
ncbi:MAG: hypothetical protein QOJ90_2296 [Actinomycetota bacterium]|jgi:hypothetical protein|nr:hypothetical protein [Actinomycetota bacterium]